MWGLGNLEMLTVGVLSKTLHGPRSGPRDLAEFGPSLVELGPRLVKQGPNLVGFGPTIGANMGLCFDRTTSNLAEPPTDEQ